MKETRNRRTHRMRTHQHTLYRVIHRYSNNNVPGTLYTRYALCSMLHKHIHTSLKCYLRSNKEQNTQGKSSSARNTIRGSEKSNRWMTVHEWTISTGLDLAQRRARAQSRPVPTFEFSLLPSSRWHKRA